MKRLSILSFFYVLLAVAVLPLNTVEAASKKTTATTATAKKVAPTAKKSATAVKTVSRKPVKAAVVPVKKVAHAVPVHSHPAKLTKTKVVHGKRLATQHHTVHTVRHHRHAAPLFSSDGSIHLHSAHALVMDQSTGKILYEKGAGDVAPIASITKLMTAMVALDANPDLSEELQISDLDVDYMRHSRSRVPVGTRLSREEMLRLALMSSENRAASALGRYYPGGKSAFVHAMNDKALALGMYDSHFYDSTGLNAGNVSTARDLARMVAAAGEYPVIRQMTSTATHDVYIGRRLTRFNNTNALVKNPDWTIEVSKTGFINEAGKCIVMKTWINSKPTILVLLDSAGSATRIADSMRVRNWLESPAYAANISRGETAAAAPAGFE